MSCMQRFGEVIQFHHIDLAIPTTSVTHNKCYKVNNGNGAHSFEHTRILQQWVIITVIAVITAIFVHPTVIPFRYMLWVSLESLLCGALLLHRLC
jgi:hypothetical protein